MKIIPLFILFSGEVAVEVHDPQGHIITHDVGIGVPYGDVHLTDPQRLEGLGFTKSDILGLPYQSNDYSYLPEVDEEDMRPVKELKEKALRTEGPLSSFLKKYTAEPDKSVQGWRAKKRE